MTFQAHFDDGPMAGQTRALQADVAADDPRDRDDPPIGVHGFEIADGEVRGVTYLRYKDPDDAGVWHYRFVPPPEST